jgi:minor extracellular serine protease Vpr
VRGFRSALAVAAVAALVISAPAGAAPRNGANSDHTGGRPTVDRSTALVQLKGAPLATAAKTKPSGGKKVDLASATTKSYRAQLSALRNEFKKWLSVNAPKARVTNGWDISLNAVSVQLNGTTLAKLRTAPMVARAELQGLYYKLDSADPDLALVDALEAWAAVGGPANAGRGVKVAIVDSGIDVTHPCFDDAGYPAVRQLGDTRYTNNKVIAAKVFHNKAKLLGVDAKAVDSHGTHVSGTVACNLDTPAAVESADIPYDVSGVAPAALLGNYNVFPGTVESARSEDILNALEAAYADGFDVANMSLGGGANGIQDLLTIAVDNLDRANMVVAVAAGNSGPGHFTVESPGSAARALTAGGFTVGHFVAAPITSGADTFGAVVGDFEVLDAPFTGVLDVVTSAPVNAVSGLAEACSALPAGSLTGKVALIGRGTCDFSTKIRFAELAGAAVVLVGNRVPGDATAMALGASPDGVQPKVPAYSVSLGDALALKGRDLSTVTIGSTLQYFDSNNDLIQYDGSGQGPTDVDFRVKPDAMAPAVNVLSSVPGDCGDLGCWSFFQGTSMATPHLAGIAAVVRGAHPGWAAWQVRSAVVNTATPGIVKSAANTSVLVNDVQIQGAGAADADAALASTAHLSPVSVSFGAVPSGSGQTRSKSVVIRNAGSASATWSLGIADTTGSGVAFSVSPASVTLAAGAQATVTVAMTATKAPSAGDHQAWLTVRAGSTLIAHAAVYAIVK